MLILDEAHRIRETSVSRWTRAEHRTGRPQVDELLSAARVPVFLLDEFQVVRPGEQGTVQDIQRHADARGIQVVRIDLSDQFRWGGSQEYVWWVKRLLGLEPGGPTRWIGDPHFEVEVVDSPWQLEADLSTRVEGGYSARLAAGYCRPWSDPRDDGTLVPDARLGDWAKPWNLKGGTLCRRRPGSGPVGERPGRLRAGRVRLHRRGLRVRLRRCRHRAGPPLAR